MVLIVRLGVSPRDGIEVVIKGRCINFHIWPLKAFKDLIVFITKTTCSIIMADICETSRDIGKVYMSKIIAG